MAAARRIKKRGYIRPDAARLHVYNEGLCAYIWDEGHASSLRKLMADAKPSHLASFFDVLSIKKLGMEVASRGMAISYTLDQDDELDIEICVGQPLTKAELGVGCWLEPQLAWLELCSGRLRIDSPNTMPLDPDEKVDRGAAVELPPGRYRLTLYRVDWAALQRARKKYRGPSEVIVLTPLSGKPSGSNSPILRFNARAEPVPSRVSAKAPKSNFNCRLVFISYWERFGVNLTRESAADLGLEPGALLQFRVDKFTIEALFLGDMAFTDFQRFAPPQLLEDLLSDHAEFAVSEWSKLLGGRSERLAFTRIKVKRCVPERLLEVWTPAEAFVRTERAMLPQPFEGPPVQIHKKHIVATVLFDSREELVLGILAGY